MSPSAFCAAGATDLEGLADPCCSFRGRGSTSEWSTCVLHGRRSASDVSCWSVCRLRNSPVSFKSDKT